MLLFQNILINYNLYKNFYEYIIKSLYNTVNFSYLYKLIILIYVQYSEFLLFVQTFNNNLINFYKVIITNIILKYYI